MNNTGTAEIPLSNLTFPYDAPNQTEHARG